MDSNCLIFKLVTSTLATGKFKLSHEMRCLFRRSALIAAAALVAITLLLMGMVASSNRCGAVVFRGVELKKTEVKKKGPKLCGEKLNNRDMNHHSILLSNIFFYHLAKNAKTLARHGVRHHSFASLLYGIRLPEV